MTRATPVDAEARPQDTTGQAEQTPDVRPDVELHLNDEDDSLYDDGLDVDHDDGGLAGTRGDTPGIAKP